MTVNMHPKDKEVFERLASKLSYGLAKAVRNGDYDVKIETITSIDTYIIPIGSAMGIEQTRIYSDNHSNIILLQQYDNAVVDIGDKIYVITINNAYGHPEKVFMRVLSEQERIEKLPYDTEMEFEQRFLNRHKANAYRSFTSAMWVCFLIIPIVIFMYINTNIIISLADATKTILFMFIVLFTIIHLKYLLSNEYKRRLVKNGKYKVDVSRALCYVRYHQHPHRHVKYMITTAYTRVGFVDEEVYNHTDIGDLVYIITVGNKQYAMEFEKKGGI